MATFVRHGSGSLQLFAWIERFHALLASELAPSSRKLGTALRMTTIATIAATVVTSCHVYSQLGVYVVWLLVGAGPMMSVRKAGTFLVAEAFALIGSVIMARTLVETPWLMLPFIFATISYSTYAGMTLKLGAPLLLIQVVCLDTFYGVVFTPGDIGWSAAGAFGGSVIAFGTILLFDNWLWPDQAEPLLMASLAASVASARARLLEASRFFLDGKSAPRPPLPPPTSDLPAHMALLNQAVAEGVSEHRRAILLAAITRVARANIEVDRLVIDARENVPREIRMMVRSEIQAAVDAITAAFKEIADDLPTHIAVGADKPPPWSWAGARAAMDALAARVTEVRPAYIGKASSAEIANFASFNDSLEVLTEYIERLLDEPPQPSVCPTKEVAPRQSAVRDAAFIRYSLKVGLCTVLAYIVGLTTQRADLSTILTTVLTTALPTYGASLRKMILRIVGAVIGGAISLLAIIIVSPNFETLPAYMAALFVVFYISAYCSLGSGRVAYAGKQIGTTFALVFAGLSPNVDIYEPLWRIWGILLGTIVVAMVFFIVWPEYAGDSLLPRLRKVIRDTLALAPGGSASRTERDILDANSETMRTLGEILEVADDAQIEGRTSTVDHNAIIDAAGTLRRIANRLASISAGRIATPMPRLDSDTESAREAVLDAIRRQLESWLDFFNGANCLSASAVRAIAQTHAPDELSTPLNDFSSRLEARRYGRIESWTFEQRRAILAELQSMRRLEFLVSELNRCLAKIPGERSNRLVTSRTVSFKIGFERSEK